MHLKLKLLSGRGAVVHRMELGDRCSSYANARSSATNVPPATTSSSKSSTASQSQSATFCSSVAATIAISTASSISVGTAAAFSSSTVRSSSNSSFAVYPPHRIYKFGLYRTVCGEWSARHDIANVL